MKRDHQILISGFSFPTLGCEMFNTIRAIPDKDRKDKVKYKALGV
jgi:hypothetical protein